jgi:DNA-binding transcriptional LysR family regulator
MDLRQIELFTAIIEHGSVTAAARALGVTQPAVSAGLARLERAVGFSLFLRDGRQVVPTAEAALLYEEAVRALAGVAQLDDAAAAIAAAARGSLTVATNPSPGIAWLPRIVAEFHRTRPDVSLNLLTRSSREVRDLVAARAFDLGIAEPPFDKKDSVVRRYRFAAVAALKADHPLAMHETLTPTLLDAAPMIGLLPSHGTTPAIAQAFAAEGAELRIVIRCEFFATALNLAAEGAGIAIVDPISAACHAAPDIAIRPFTPRIIYEVAVLKPAQSGLSRLAEAFAAAIDQHVRPYLTERSS